MQKKHTPGKLIILLFKIYKQSGIEGDKEKYIECRRVFKQMVWQSKSNYEYKLAQNIKRDTKGFYSYASTNKNSRSSIGPIEDTCGQLLVNNIDMARELNKFFSSVFLNSGKLDNLHIKFDESAINTVNFTRDRVFKAIQKLKPNKAPCPDNIYPRVLIEAADVVSDMLKFLFFKIT